MRTAWLWFLVPALILGGLVWWLAALFPGSLEGEGSRITLVRHAGWLTLIGSAVLVRLRSRPATSLRHAAVWLAVGAALVLGYSFRFEVSELGDRLAGAVVPSRAIEQAGGAVTIRAGRDGHFAVDAEVDGARVRFLVDTGASDIVLSPSDARRLGFDLEPLVFSRRYRTANGVILGAPVRLGKVRVGSITVNGVAASVNGAEMERSLLGMSFLDRLSGYEVARGTLTLRP